jgi:oligosaccharide repeat unit polymerase
MSGSRFPLLFSSLGFIFISFDFDKLSYILIVKRYVPIVLILLLTTQVMMVSRSSGYGSLDDFFNSDDSTIVSNVDILSASLATTMSPEGIIQSYAKMIGYFETHPFLYGQSSGFLLYFWVPRSIWPEKPKMLGYWMVRATDSDVGFSSGHSASYGFCGDFYADFGMFGAIFFSFGIGLGLKKLEQFRAKRYAEKGTGLILAVITYPFVFFAVRSPITSSMTTIGLIVVYMVLSKILFEKSKTMANANPKIQV